MSDLCTSASIDAATARGRLFEWLARGAQDVAWVVCSLPRERWLATPPGEAGAWPAARHVRQLAVRETCLTLPSVRHALGDALVRDGDQVTVQEVEPTDTAWEPLADEASVLEDIRTLGEARFELLQRLESAPDDAWERPLPSDVAPRLAGDPVGISWLVARSYQHELEHLGALWRLLLYWDRIPQSAASTVQLALHPADRREESH